LSRTPAHLSQAVPILCVRSLAASLDYYTQALGFSIGWEIEGYAQVKRDRCLLMLCEGRQGHAGTWVWTAADDVDLLHDEWKASGANILQGPANFPWGSREIHVLDPDGHRLRFGSSPLKEGESMGEFVEG
jgi:predicted enzyme related to lactoylglutathione lyase